MLLSKFGRKPLNLHFVGLFLVLLMTQSLYSEQGRLYNTPLHTIFSYTLSTVTTLHLSKSLPIAIQFSVLVFSCCIEKRSRGLYYFPVHCLFHLVECSLVPSISLQITRFHLSLQLKFTAFCMCILIKKEMPVVNKHMKNA